MALTGELLRDLTVSRMVDMIPRWVGVGSLEVGVTEEALAASSSFWIASLSSLLSSPTLSSSWLCLGDTAPASSFPISASSA
jgi:hypothetical protein